MLLNLEEAVWYDCPECGPGCRETDRVLIHDGTEWIASAHWVDLGDGVPRVFFHLEVFYLSASILREMQARWKQWRAQEPGLIFTMADRDTPVLDRLRKKFGFEVLRHKNGAPWRVHGSDKRSRKLFVHYV